MAKVQELDYILVWMSVTGLPYSCLSLAHCKVEEVVVNSLAFFSEKVGTHLLLLMG